MLVYENEEEFQIMEQRDLTIENYTYERLENHFRYAIVQFYKSENQEEKVSLQFDNGSRSTNFLLHCLGDVDYWEDASDLWKNKKIEIAFQSGQPIALVEKDHKRICFIKSSDTKKYGVSKKELKQFVKKSA